ncbi:MAG: type II secretion system protein [Patescibacteria group bacterium]
MLLRRKGFTLVELMVSIAILLLISTTTVFSLGDTRNNDELMTAARLLVGDIRNVQARALAATNIRTCDTSSGQARVCETENPSVISCSSDCTPLPPPRVGVEFESGSSGYTIFADVHTEDWRLTNDEEIVLQRDMNPLGGDKVTVSAIQTTFGSLSQVNLAVGRQNGTMRIEACGDTGLPACAPKEPQTLSITLIHAKTARTVTVDVNAVTGRVSFQ